MNRKSLGVAVSLNYLIVSLLVVAWVLIEWAFESALATGRMGMVFKIASIVMALELVPVLVVVVIGLIMDIIGETEP